MCYRPSWVEGKAPDNVQSGTCPSCGMPVAAPVGVDSGTCPHCSKPIPLKPTTGAAKNADKKIL